MWCLIVVLWLWPVLTAVGSGAGPPHIVVIMADDMGWNDVSFHGSSQIMTPNIDALAYQGTILNRHYTLPSCSPSRAAFLTGRYAVNTGMQDPIISGSVRALSLNFTLLPQHLSRLGYQNHLVGKWHLGSAHDDHLPLRRGFHSFFGFYSGFIGYYDGIHREIGMVGIDAWRNETGAWQEFAGHYLTDLLTKEAVSIIKSHKNLDSPMYLQVALSAPHTGNLGGELQVRDLAQNDRDHSHISDIRRRLYAGMVRGVDDSVGAILEALRSSNMLQNAIVLFTSDNGAPTLDPFWGYSNYGSNWPLRGMKMSCHEGGVRTAAALWSPLLATGRISDQLIHMTDWLPTLYSAAGGDVNDLGSIDGVDQWAALVGKGWAGRRTELLVDLSPLSNNEALIKWPWKIVRYTGNNNELNTHAGESGQGPEVPQYSVGQVTSSRAALALAMDRSEQDLLALRDHATINDRCSEIVTSMRPCVHNYCLFNLHEDPCEQKDLSTLHPTVVVALQRTLDSYRRVMVPPVTGLRDPRSHPNLWCNYWAPWVNNETVLAGAGFPQGSIVLVACIILFFHL